MDAFIHHWVSKNSEIIGACVTFAYAGVMCVTMEYFRELEQEGALFPFDDLEVIDYRNIDENLFSRQLKEVIQQS